MSAASNPPQGAQIRVAMTISGLMMAHQVAGKAARDAIFLSEFQVAALPRIVATAALAAVVISFWRGRTLVRFGPFRATAVSFAASGVLQAAEWMLLRYEPRIAACAIYLHVVAFGAVLLSGYWSVMNEYFDTRSAKDIFGRIGGMGTLGGLCGGVVAERVATWWAPSAVVLLLAVLHLMCAVLLWGMLPSTSAVRRAETLKETTLLDAVHRYPFLLTLAGVILSCSAGTAVLDFAFKAQAAKVMGQGAPLLRFFGLYYTATSLFTFLVQTFAVGPIVKHAGLAASVRVLPGTIALGSLASALVPGFKLLSGVRGAEILTRGSVFRSAYELFFIALAPSEKRAVKSFIDVGMDRMGDAVGAAGVSLLLILAPGHYGPILVTSTAFAALALVLSTHLQKGYLLALENSLVGRGIEIDPSMAEDSATRSVLLRSAPGRSTARWEKQPESPASARSAAQSDALVVALMELRSGDPSRVVRAAARIEPGSWELGPLLIDLLAWDEVFPAARSALELMGTKITGMLVDVLLDLETDFTIRRRVPRVLALLPSMRTVEGLFAALDDHRFEVRFYSGRALYLLLRDHAHLRISDERVWAAINRELSLQKSLRDTQRLIESRDLRRDKEWYFDTELLDRARQNLEHLFTLLALLLPADAVRVAFRALHTDDRQLQGTAFEYLESATPASTRHLLLPLLEVDSQNRTPAGAADGALASLLATQVQVNETLKIDPRPMESR
jgi:AAA family ATP:ADP antiporter